MLDITAEIKKIQNFYEADTRQSTFKCLLLGESGGGKTYSLRTCRKPIHIDSFDPGGTLSLYDLIKKGEVIADTRWEKEDPESPSVYLKWNEEFQARRKNGYFEHFGTYVLDSATTWSDAIMGWILKARNASGERPDFTKDYVPQKIAIEKRIYQMMNLPCDFILTGHLELYKGGDAAGTARYRFMTTGKGAVKIPLLFDEQYVTVTKETSKGVEYQFLTRPTGMYVARSRLAQGNKLETYEEPNFKHLLKKAGLPHEDKPPLGKGGDDN